MLHLNLSHLASKYIEPALYTLSYMSKVVKCIYIYMCVCVCECKKVKSHIEICQICERLTYDI
jgi:hypothetical protein